MDISINSTFLPHNDPDESLAFYRDTLGFEVRNDVGYAGMRWLTVGPAGQPGTSIVLYPPFASPGITDDERRTIEEMMAKEHLRHHRPGHPPTSTPPSSGYRPAAPRSSRSRPSSRTGFATAPSATLPATSSASARCAEGPATRDLFFAFQLLATDDRQVHLVRPVHESGRPRIGEHLGKRQILGDAGPAVHLDGAVDHRLRDIRGDHLDRRYLEARPKTSLGIEQPRGLLAQQPGLLDLDARPGDLLAHHTLLGKALAKGCA